MLCPAGRRALSWASLLLLVGFQPQGTRAWCSEKDTFNGSPYVSDPDTVMFALSAFNKQSKDEYAYRLSQLLSFSKAQTKQPETFSMKMMLERTICKKFEESLDTCPFQESHELNNTITCFFTISTQRPAQQFRVLKKTCSEGLPDWDHQELIFQRLSGSVLLLKMSWVLENSLCTDSLYRIDH